MSEFKELEQFVRDRITQLRIQKNVTEYKLSMKDAELVLSIINRLRA